MMNPFWRVEFHCHTYYSKDSLTRPAQLVQTCQMLGIDRVVVTDHNEIEGALRAQDLDPERVIVGEEIMTTQGELLAAFVRQRIPRGLSPSDAIAALREQGAFISVSHPFDRVRSGAWNLADLEQIVPLVDAIEVFNSRCMDAEPNRLAAEFAARHGLSGTVGSDAHTLKELGRANLLLAPFSDPAGLKAALPAARGETRLSSPWVHFSSSNARLAKRLFKHLRPPKIEPQI
jgi:predicted metal-dependent phosphoesterase TrpH